jgi:hypothetical protein
MMKRNGFWQGWVVAIALTGLSAASSAQALAAPLPGTFECVAGDVVGVKATDGQTAVGIVCRELGLASGQTGRYRVSLRSLGYSVILEAERLDSPQRQTLTLAGVEETPTAAPRLARAMVHHEPLAKTQRVDNLLMDETRETPLKGGKVSWGLGVLGLEVPGQGVSSGGGFLASVAYNTPDFEVPAQFRVAGGGSGGQRGAHLVGFDVGMRWIVSRKNVSPFIGGGLGWLSWKVGDPVPGAEWSEQATYSGAAPYVEAGIEMLRLHSTRLLLSVRADLPLQNVVRPDSWYPDYSGTTYRQVTVPGRSFYAVPVTLGMSVAF